MFGIPSTSFDYTIDPEIFDVDDFEYDPTQDDEKNIFRLRKQIIAAYREAKFTNREAEQVATRNVLLVLENAKDQLNSVTEEE
jgi:hypothetical protein